MSAQFQQPVRLVVTIPTAGTPVQLSATPIYVRAFTLQAHFQNVGVALLGDSSANALVANAHALAPGDNFSLAGSQIFQREVQIDLSHFWVDTTVSGSKVIVTFLQETLHQ